MVEVANVGEVLKDTWMVDMWFGHRWECDTSRAWCHQPRWEAGRGVVVGGRVVEVEAEKRRTSWKNCEAIK